LYWQPLGQVPYANITNPFYACYNDICGVRFNGINQRAQSWVYKNWLASNQSSIVWQFFVFPNQTAYDSKVYPTNTQYTILQGSIVSDSGYNAHYVPASVSGYVAQVNLTGISGAFGVYVRAHSTTTVNNILRIEIYENGVLVSSTVGSLSTTYRDIYLKPNFLAKSSNKYTLKIYSTGGADIYIWLVYVYTNIGSTGFEISASYDPFFIGLAWSGVVNYITDAGAVYRGIGSSLNRVGRLQTVTITVNNTLLAMYFNASLVNKASYSYGILQTNSYFTIGAPYYYYFYGLTPKVLAYNRSLTASEVSAVNAGTVPSNGLLFYFVADPRYLYDIDWNGYVDWQDLSGNGNHVKLVNFHSQGSFTNAPQRQPYNMLIIAQTCNTQLCSYTVNSGDPYFTVIVSDSSGKQSQATTGMSVPLWQSPLGSVVLTIGKTVNLDAWGVNVNDFIIFLIGLAIIYGAFTYMNWELGLITFGAWLTVGTLLLGGSGRLMVPGISLALFGAAISYMLKREQAP
jgi:hypothetical protein